MTSHFTKEQLQEMETRYGLKAVYDEILEVRDGVVNKDSMVWWRCEHGPEYVRASSSNHWENIRNYPNAYQLAEPDYKITYKD